MRRRSFNIPYEFYWTGKIKMPVIYPFGKGEWHGVYGVQIGTMFIGVVFGEFERGTQNDRQTKGA